MPDPVSARYFSSEIERLSGIYSTYPFVPHITVGRVPDDSPHTPEEIVTTIAQGLSPKSLKTGKLLTSGNPYQNLTVDIPETLFLTTFSKNVELQLGPGTSKDEFHLSLLYGFVPAEKLGGEIKRIKQKMPVEIIPQRLAVFSVEGPPPEWKELASEKL